MYYVSTSGNNSNSGTSLSQAWRTIQHAMDEATANSIVLIEGGFYNEKVAVNVSGTAGNWITFKNLNDNQVTLSGNGITSQVSMIEIYSREYIAIEGLQIIDNQQTDAQGVLIEGASHHIRIENNVISEINFSANPNAPVNENTNSQPIIVYGDDGSNPITDLSIIGNTIHNCRTGFSEALAVNGNVNGFEVRNNLVYDNTNIGIDIIGFEGTASSNDQARNGVIKGNIVHNCVSPYATAAGIYVDGARDLLIENNTVFNCQWGIEVGCENVGKATSDIVVRNNLVYNNEDAGLVIGGFDYPSGSGKVTNTHFRNNTFYNNDTNTGGVGGVTGELNVSYTEDCSIVNNIFYGTNSSDLIMYVDDVSSINLLLDYNLYQFDGPVEYDFEGTVYSSFSDYQAGSGQDDNSLFDDPEFVDKSMSDFHILATSAAVDAGDPNYSPGPDEVDMDSEARIVGNRIDIGSDEYAGMTQAHIVVEPASISINYNPSTDMAIVEGALDDFDVHVIDVAGNIVADYSTSASPVIIDLTSLGPGMFFISVAHHSLPDLRVYKILHMP